MAEHILATINATLSDKGLMLREDTVVDVTLIAAPSSTKNRDEQRDCEMHQTKKGNQWQFGYTKVKCRGLTKNTANLMTLFALSNLWMARRRLLQGLQGYVRQISGKEPATRVKCPDLGFKAHRIRHHAGALGPTAIGKRVLKSILSWP